MRSLKRILYLEKDKVVSSETLFSLQEKGGFEIYNFNSSEDVFKNAENIHPDLVILNVELPDLSCAEFLFKLRKYDHLSQIPAVIVTNRLKARDKLDCQELMIVDFLSKSIRGKDLIIRLHEIWGEWSEKE